MAESVLPQKGRGFSEDEQECLLLVRAAFLSCSRRERPRGRESTEECLCRELRGVAHEVANEILDGAAGDTSKLEKLFLELDALRSSAASEECMSDEEIDSLVEALRDYVDACCRGILLKASGRLQGEGISLVRKLDRVIDRIDFGDGASLEEVCGIYTEVRSYMDRILRQS